MRFFYLLLCPVWLMLLWSNQLSAQNTTTYSLEIHSIISEYGNTLGPVVGQSIKDQWPNWEQVSSGTGDYHIRVDFLEGLDAKQYHRKKADRRQYIYDVKYITPRFDAIVTDNTGNTILQKNYGGETVFSPFGADDEYASPDTLADAWRLHRDAFYELEESKYNTANELLTDISEIVNDGASAMIEMIETKLEEIAEKEEVVLAVAEKENIKKNNKATTTTNSKEISNSNKEPITPQVPNRKIPSTSEETNGSSEQVETPTPYTKPEVNRDSEVGIETTNSNQVKIDPSTGRVAGETPPVPTPQQRNKEEQIETEAKLKETEAQLEARLARIQAEWDEMEEEDIKKHKKPRVRHFRVGARMLVPNILGPHGEIVLPILNNRISIVGDFSQWNFGPLLEPFLDDDTSVKDVDLTYRYFSVGANYYFRKKYARGWYLGASYLNSLVKSELKDSSGEAAKGEADIDAAALRFGITTGRKTFFFGFEIGAGLPLQNLTGAIYTETDGDLELEVLDEKVDLIPILNITFGAAF